MARRESTRPTVRATSNDSTGKLLNRVEQRLRRVGKTRGNRELKTAYKTAADLIRKVNPAR